MRLSLLATTALTSLLFCGCISKQMRALDATGADNTAAVTVVADRGASLIAPENTIAAFDRAQEQGAVAVELDVQVSQDGRLVIFRDDQLDQKTSLHGTVASHPWSELQPIDFAHWFSMMKHQGVNVSVTPAPSGAQVENRAHTSGIAVPRRKPLKRRARSYRQKKTEIPKPLSVSRILTLNEVFEHYGLTFQYFIVVHAPAGADEAHSVAATVQAVIKLVKEYAVDANAIVGSSDSSELAKLHSSNPAMPICYLVDDTKTKDLGAEIQRAIQYGFQYVGLRTTVVNHDHVKRAAAGNVKIFAYDPAPDDQMVNAAKAGASAIASPEPGRISKLIEDASKIRY